MTDTHGQQPRVLPITTSPIAAGHAVRIPAGSDHGQQHDQGETLPCCGSTVPRYHRPGCTPDMRMAVIAEQANLTDEEAEELKRRFLEAVAKPSRVTWEVEEQRIVDLAEVEARGYAQAVANLRNDSGYGNWWSARPYRPEDRYWTKEPRNHLADYLEAVGPQKDQKLTEEERRDAR